MPGFRKDMPYVGLLLQFQEFDSGREVSEVIDGEFDLEPGDTFIYESGSNISGMGKIVSTEKPSGGKTRITIKKVY